MARRTKEIAEKTRQKLIDAAEEVFLEKGVTCSSLCDIANKAGVTRGALYWHFDHKMALFDAMHERVKLPLDALFEKAVNGENPIENLKNLSIHVLSNMEDDEHLRRVFTIIMFKCEKLDESSENAMRFKERRKEVIENFNKVFTYAQNNRKLRSDLTPEIAAISLHAFIIGVLHDYLQNPDAYSIKQIAPVLVESFFRGVLR
jgi:AcrR family transcriptional regulator